MKKFFSLLFFAVLAGLFSWLWFSRSALSYTPENRKSVRTIVPDENGKNAGSGERETSIQEYDESKIQPLIMIGNDETFLQAITVDLDQDGASDQVCAVKKISDQSILLVPGIQNPLTGEYVRLEPIGTGIAQARTLVFYSLDLIGDRKNVLVFSGMSQDNMQILAAYLPETDQNGTTSLNAIVNLRADGSITIQDIARSDAYNLGLTPGESYPIFTYNSDPDSPDTLDQIERMYVWDKMLRRYIQKKESKVPGKKIETRLVNQLQSGNIDSFEQFLDGLWYMTTTASGSPSRSLFFDLQNSEIVFHSESTEEIFFKESGAPRRYGIYLTTRNSSISSIRRLIDIELTGIDEIRMKVVEDVKLKITVASSWDGIYRKRADGRAGTQGTATPIPAGLFQTPLDSWTAEDGSILKTLRHRYVLVRGATEETGSWAFLTAGNEPVVQMKADGEQKKSNFYTIALTGSAVNKDSILTLTEVSVSTAGTQRTGAPAIEWKLFQE